MRSSERQDDTAAQAGLEVIVVSGLSGSGKSTAIHVLEDLGYYCIDNLPAVLVPRFLELCTTSLARISRVALGIDIRERQFFADYPRVLDELRRSGHRVEVVFLEASDDALVRRFSETRRPHPLGGEGGPLAGIQRERAELVGVREGADRIFDTSALTVHQLRDELRQLFRAPDRAAGFTVLLVSFGYKFGIPTDIDMLLDARFLPNPFFVDELRPQTGSDPAVASYVLDRDETRVFLRMASELLDFALPQYRREGRSYFTLAVGCTGGRHRSVALVERLAEVLARGGTRVQVQHRDARR
ncbi:MAG: RNase adapter RapZ [Candidatus Binatia bacterium]